MWALADGEGFNPITRGAKAVMLTAVPKALRAQVLDVMRWFGGERA